MSEPVLIQRQRTLLHDLYQLVEDRAAAEPNIHTKYRTKAQEIDKDLQEARQWLETRFQAEKEGAEKEYTDARQKISSRFETEQASAQKEFDEVSSRIRITYEREKQATENEYQEARWTISAVFEGNKNGAEAELKELRGRMAAGMLKLESIKREARALLKEWRQDPDAVPESGGDAADDQDKDNLGTLHACVTTAEELLADLKSLTAPRFLKGTRLVLLFVVLWLASLYPGWLLGQILGVAAVTGLVVILGVVTTLLVRMVAGSQVQSIYQPLCQALIEGESLRKRCQDQIAAAYQRQVVEAKKQQDRDLNQAKEKYLARRSSNKQRQTDGTQQTTEKYQRVKAESQQRHDSELETEEKRYKVRQFECKMRYDTHSREIQEKFGRLAHENETSHEEAWNTMAGNWEMGMVRLQAIVAGVNQEASRLFPAWNHPVWEHWLPGTALPPGIRFGEYAVSMTAIPNGIPEDDRLRRACPPDFTLPGLLAFPERCSLLFEGCDEGRALAVQSLQTVMLRFLTTFPAGKVRYTIVDPVGLGENFAAFMHLADYDEQLVASRIWTEQQHIEHRLTDLTAHMENVIQKYLRNQFQTIEEYNAHAGEVAEPFRILVVANFPANFSVEAIRRLISIASTGARCGVYTLISVDTKHPMPQGFDLADLEQNCTTFLWKDGRFHWKESDFGKYPLKLDTPPDADFCTRILQIVGEKAKDANRVEVPFEFISPPPPQWWTGDTRAGINVPLGRAGATKRQHLQLGKGTAQHVLIAGKTGSGKSTLLHALITNLSLLYSPDEVELYLIDFKKGVEFKTYATHELPHARIIAIESEREFGLSVLQRLDAELKLRGDRFREAGAQDVASYRQITGANLARILFIVDEFQEFFTEDDKISQEAAGLLDRLVRQGRAFGLHVLLGSQTLGGAYTLARSTIDQMAVRIALQCSEADAHLILSDDNSAARLLSRPGEAIYNDANGLVEGNNPFQVVWLPDERREDYLKQVGDLDRRRNQVLSRPQIVFEGNAPADVGKNHLLNELLLSAAWPPCPLAFQAWLGEAMAIKDPTAAVFRRQSGSNLLVVGQHDEAALGILATAIVSLAAQHTPPEGPSSPAGARFYVLDGTLADAPHAGFLARLADVIPHPLRVIGPREVPNVIGELAEEADRRQKENDPEAPTLYLLIYGLQRFRDLRRSDDDFGFGGRSEKASPAQQFGTLLREGAGLGVHTLVWSDTLNNVSRTLDRQGLREFEMRVLFQMSVQDSSNLIDSPVASKLGLHRALFSSEEQGRLEKFRPYGLPTESWLEWVREQLRGRQAVALNVGQDV